VHSHLLRVFGAVSAARALALPGQASSGAAAVSRAAGPPAAWARPATAAPATGTGKITIYSSSKIRLANRPYTSDGITAGPDGALWFTNPDGNTIGRITTPVTPAICMKTPTSGAPGTRVTITGSNLSPATHVTFNGTTARIVSGTATHLVTVVPAGATTGPIAVTTPAGTTTTNGWFTVK